MRTLIAIIVLVFATANLTAQEVKVKPTDKKQISDQKPAELKVFNLETHAKEIGLTQEQEAKVEALNVKATKDETSFTQRAYMKELAGILDAKQLSKWKTSFKSKASLR